MRTAKIIIVDDNETVLKTLRVILSREFKTVLTVQFPTLLPALLREDDVDVVLLDMNFGTGKQTGGEGLFWLDKIRERSNPPEVVLITAFGDIELAVASLKKGAADFIIKPWENEKLVNTIIAAWEKRRERIFNPASPDETNIISQLIDFFLKKYAVAYGKPFPSLNREARDKLTNQLLTGNIPIVEQSIERAMLLNNTVQLTADDFIFDRTELAASTSLTLDDIEKQFIQTVLAEKKGNLTLAAQQLNITRQTLYNKLKKYDL
ncbi:DNA-binding NtrC family response regulator [Parabacteroides sp. PF5-5]|uniref:response regulator n=1 Tax=unclassified Parabacteroides TaxID=2649774 RepID=UPI0024766FF0|nr:MULTISPECIES: response regulator [unclassified Parabacteroides]MDH6304542.1 DNA-binding NtrC family response regulator [Parabacteroides sp. PH5-39]MDH6315306.1 DNA-binding NtrC family response regulator [Parabacteroides sp. PF5-13]MDH6319200.1 DNA-binding NtrC family response regulator [Parabacteroides sp. PH5-13]MDH6322931.1 DNA-binding NtrC family response regulator [Parabacteroides sp. PH5-8]MDH6326497.1 DNA-binding NtrC family response regulator [Parabacteroides sp. PH5-41]